MGNFSFFSEEMTDPLVAFVGQWRPDLIVYPPLGVVGPLIAAKYDIPVVMQTVGFGHTPWHIKGVTKSLSNAYRRHGGQRATKRSGVDRRHNGQHEHTAK